MKSFVIFFALLTVRTVGLGQKTPYLVDSVMNHYMESGYANKHFIPKGKTDKNGLAQGFWKDYVVLQDIMFLASAQQSESLKGYYLLYGEGQYVDNKREGSWLFWVIEDKTFKHVLQKKVNYVKDTLQGPVTYYFPSGSPALDGTFKANEREGKATFYYESGELHLNLFYDNGLRTGLSSFFYKDGNKNGELNFTRDTLNGPTITWYQNGEIEETVSYVMGKRNGDYKYYYDNGQLWVEKEYKNGLTMNVIVNYDRNGNMHDKGTLKDGNGTVISYTEDGKIYLVETFKAGQIIKEEKF